MIYDYEITNCICIGRSWGICIRMVVGLGHSRVVPRIVFEVKETDQALSSQ